MAHDVTDCVFGEGHASKTQPVIPEVVLGHVPQLPDADLPPRLNVVEALLEFPPSLIFGHSWRPFLRSISTTPG